MIIEFGNHAAKRGLDQAPKVTTLLIPEADVHGLGGYTHAPGAITAEEFRSHRSDAMDFRDGVTQLPDHEILIAAANAWPQHAVAPPAWVRVTSHEDRFGVLAEDAAPLGQDGGRLTLSPHASHAAADIENVLRDFYRLPDKAVAPPADELEARYWTTAGAPGVFPTAVSLPDAQALFTNSGRVLANSNDGGGMLGVTGTATSATATTLTVAAAPSVTVPSRVYVMQTATGPIIWGNVVSSASTTITVDRWYTAATPGGAAPAAPSGGYYYIIPDGGMVSAWFVGLTTTNITPAVTDTALSGEYSVAAGGMFRKIAPYSQTSGTSPRTLTLTPVYTANGSDTFPSTFYAIGVGVSMVVPFPATTMKWETSLNASFQVGATGDQGTVTETVTGS